MPWPFAGLSPTCTQRRSARTQQDAPVDFLALLELLKEALIEVVQTEAYAPIHVRAASAKAVLADGQAGSDTELAELQDMAPGDLIVTGTPGGTAVKAPGGLRMLVARLLPDAKRWQLFIKGALKDPAYLQDGDVMEAWAKTPDGRIDLGAQRNLIVTRVKP